MSGLSLMVAGFVAGVIVAWLGVALLLKLYETLGDSIAPASPSFWLQCPLPTPIVVQPRRRTKREIMIEKRITATGSRRQVGHGHSGNGETMKWP
jgi:hypothetical protein